MLFAGLQKLTLLDFPQHIACTIFTQGCGFRCPFCHNSSLLDPCRAPEQPMLEEDILAFLQKRRGTLDGVCLTGGEPLMHEELRDFILRTNQPDSLKRSVFGLLKKLGVSEPYIANLDGRWIAGRVNMLDYAEGVPAAYADIIRASIEQMSGVRSEKAMDASIYVFKNYTERLKGTFPRLSTQQAQAFSAALEFIGCYIAEETVGTEEICKKYRVTETRLKNAIARLRPEQEE